MSAIGTVRAGTHGTQSVSAPHNLSVEGRFTKLIPQVATNLNKIAIPAITLFALANLPTVNGGPLSYATCTAACLALAGPAIPPCIAACIYVGLCPWLP